MIHQIRKAPNTVSCLVGLGFLAGVCACGGSSSRRVDTQNPVPLRNGTELDKISQTYFDGRVSSSRSGKKTLFVSGRDGSGNQKIYKIDGSDATSTAQRLTTSDLGKEVGAAISADGTRTAILAFKDNVSSVYVQNYAATAGPTKLSLATTDIPIALAFSPDSSLLMVKVRDGSANSALAYRIFSVGADISVAGPKSPADIGTTYAAFQWQPMASGYAVVGLSQSFSSSTVSLARWTFSSLDGAASATSSTLASSLSGIKPQSLEASLGYVFLRKDFGTSPKTASSSGDQTDSRTVYRTEGLHHLSTGTSGASAEPFSSYQIRILGVSADPGGTYVLSLGTEYFSCTEESERIFGNSLWLHSPANSSLMVRLMPRTTASGGWEVITEPCKVKRDDDSKGALDKKILAASLISDADTAGRYRVIYETLTSGDQEVHQMEFDFNGTTLSNASIRNLSNNKKP